MFLSWVFTFLILCSQTFAATLPQEEIPPVQKQTVLYREAYAPFNHEGFQPQTMNIPGLVPLTRMAYSYTASLLPEGDSRHALLARFWQETQADIEAQKLTISYFKKTNLRLAFLVAQTQKTSYFSRELPLFTELLQQDNWQHIASYDFVQDDLGALIAQPYPLCFEAVLYHPKGEISLKTFADNYLGSDFTLGLAAFSQTGSGPHGDYINDSAAFLFHDFVHWENLSKDMQSDSESRWLDCRDLFRKIYQAEPTLTSFTKVGLFLLLHEYIPYVGSIFSPKTKEGVVADLDKTIDRDIPENLDLSERLYFKRSIGLATQDIM